MSATDFALVMMAIVIANLLMCIVNVSCIGHDNRFTRWWLRSVPYALGASCAIAFMACVVRVLT